MKILTGVDLVYLPRFKKSLKNGGENFLRRVFNESELSVNTRGVNVFHLGGVFAAKEAIIKALSLPPDAWHDIQIIHRENGLPVAKILHSPFSILNSSLSISHDGKYVIAQFVAFIK